MCKRKSGQWREAGVPVSVQLRTRSVLGARASCCTDRGDHVRSEPIGAKEPFARSSVELIASA
jgi:hypothetical protein